ncbi:viral integrase [Microplitis demolitor]|uniref:viral integrase n=1 Tax=Microplitis demolitor TaxID=69319 RepID=UPI00043FFEDA|nr:viral integrase [Microplitis demolitor]KAG6558346.1 viral integrase [Microplitis demolitor]
MSFDRTRTSKIEFENANEHLLNIQVSNHLTKLNKIQWASYSNQNTLPIKILEIIFKLRLHEITDAKDRTSLLVRELLQRHLRHCTIIKYLKNLKNYSFLCIESLNLEDFVTFSPYASSSDIPTYFDVINMLEWCTSNRHKHHLAYAVLFGYYSGLFETEICGMTNENLIQLYSQEPIIAIEGKYSNGWEAPYYHKILTFIDELVDVFYDKIELYSMGFTDKLFDILPSTFSFLINQYYKMAVGKIPPIGFSLRLIKYMVNSIIKNKKMSINDSNTIKYLEIERNLQDNLNFNTFNLKRDLEKLNRKLKKVSEMNFSINGN